jgi:8-oxo-dGTP diphosphatase
MNRTPELTTLCYIERDDCYLMLHRVKKQNDINKDKYIGVGGHFQYGESPDECLKREVMEETGLALSSYRARGIVTFCYGEDITEYMHLYTATIAPGTEPGECDEGDLIWVAKDRVTELPIWEGDRIFLRLLREERPYFSLKLVYAITDELTEVQLDGEVLQRESR